MVSPFTRSQGIYKCPGSHFIPSFPAKHEQVDDRGLQAVAGQRLKAVSLDARARPVEWSRRLGLPDDSVVSLRGLPVPLWEPTDAASGELVSFLSDAPRPRLGSPVVFEVQPDIDGVLRRSFEATPPLQVSR